VTATRCSLTRGRRATIRSRPDRAISFSGANGTLHAHYECSRRHHNLTGKTPAIAANRSGTPVTPATPRHSVLGTIRNVDCTPATQCWWGRFWRRTWAAERNRKRGLHHVCTLLTVDTNETTHDITNRHEGLRSTRTTPRSEGRRLIALAVLGLVTVWSQTVRHGLQRDVIKSCSNIAKQQVSITTRQSLLSGITNGEQLRIRRLGVRLPPSALSWCRSRLRERDRAALAQNGRRQKRQSAHPHRHRRRRLIDRAREAVRHGLTIARWIGLNLETWARGATPASPISRSYESRGAVPSAV
jgi:hypothetical protein